MPKNLFDYADEMKSENVDTMKEEYLKNKVNEYSKLSETEMLTSLLSEVQSAKMNGTFNYEKIASSMDTIRAYLTPEQQKNLENLLKKIR